MPTPAIRFDWKRPVEGVQLVTLSRSKSQVLVPARGLRTDWESFAASESDVDAIARELARLRVEKPEALATFASTWGGFGVPHASVALSEDYDDVLAKNVLVEPVSTVQLAVLEYQTALALHAGAGELRRDGDQWRARLRVPEGMSLDTHFDYPKPRIFWRNKRAGVVETLDALPARSDKEARAAWVRHMVAARRQTWELPDDVTFGWKVVSPLGAGWRVLANALAGKLKVRLCKHCKRPFLPKLSDKRRLTSPPLFCSDSCRVSKARKRLASPGKSKPRPLGRAGSARTNDRKGGRHSDTPSNTPTSGRRRKA